MGSCFSHDQIDESDHQSLYPHTNLSPKHKHKHPPTRPSSFPIPIQHIRPDTLTHLLQKDPTIFLGQSSILIFRELYMLNTISYIFYYNPEPDYINSEDLCLFVGEDGFIYKVIWNNIIYSSTHHENMV